jgi:hypothetical protein
MPSIDNKSWKIAEWILEGVAFDWLHNLAVESFHEKREIELKQWEQKKLIQDTKPEAILYINLNNGERLF